MSTAVAPANIVHIININSIIVTAVTSDYWRFHDVLQHNFSYGDNIFCRDTSSEQQFIGLLMGVASAAAWGLCCHVLLWVSQHYPHSGFLLTRQQKNHKKMQGHQSTIKLTIKYSFIRSRKLSTCCHQWNANTVYLSFLGSVTAGSESTQKWCKVAMKCCLRSAAKCNYLSTPT